MSSPDLHPEDLIDKEANGALSPDEALRLKQHFARCATCRFERAARADFRRESAGAGERASSPSLAGILERVTADAARHITTPPPGSLPSPCAQEPETKVSRPSTPVRRLPKRWTTMLLVAAVLLLGSGAMAGLSHGFRSAVTGLFVAPPSEEDRSSTHATQAATKQGPASIPAPPASAPPASVLAPVVAPEASEAPAATSVATPPTPVIALAREPAARASQLAPSVRSAVPAAIAPAPVVATAPEAPAVVAPPAHDARELFAVANDARARGDRAQAIVLFRDLERAYPASQEARVSHVTIGRLLLDDSDPSAALASFDAYLSDRGGALEEEALLGRATALGRLGRVQDEKQAWSILLANYPRSSHAPRARARLEDLDRR
jgi:TolA-binding protein